MSIIAIILAFATGYLLGKKGAKEEWQTAKTFLDSIKKPSIKILKYATPLRKETETETVRPDVY